MQLNSLDKSGCAPAIPGKIESHELEDVDSRALQDKHVLRGRRLLISEEALKDQSGHWYEYCRSVARINSIRGVECIVAASADIADDIVNELRFVRAYPVTSWDIHSRKRPAWRRYCDIVVHNYRVYRTMHRVLQEYGPFDLVFAPTVVIYHIIGWRLLAARHLNHDVGRMVLLFRNNAGSYEAGGSVPKFKKSTNVLKWALQSFARFIRKGDVALATDSERLADEYEALCGLRPEVFPSPRVAPPSLPQRFVDGARAVTLTALGPARFEKGIDVLQEAIYQFLRRRPEANVRFLIQWNVPIIRGDGDIYLPDRRLEADSRVKFLTETLTSAQYQDALLASDGMILPYRRASYFARISGVAVEGVTLGIPLIYTLDTWCESLVEEAGAGVGCKDGDSEDVCRAIERFVDGFDGLREKALGRAAKAREMNSAEAFVEKLWFSGRATEVEKV